jgi:hypothetical protein
MGESRDRTHYVGCSAGGTEVTVKSDPRGVHGYVDVHLSSLFSYRPAPSRKILSFYPDKAREVAAGLIAAADRADEEVARARGPYIVRIQTRGGRRLSLWLDAGGRVRGWLRLSGNAAYEKAGIDVGGWNTEPCSDRGHELRDDPAYLRAVAELRDVDQRAGR